MCFEICNFLFEYYFGRVCSEESEGFPFNEAFFNSLLVTGSKMGILKCLSWFEMSTHIKDCVSFESFPFVDVGVQECSDSRLEIVICKLHVRKQGAGRDEV